ncbi:Mitochondrial distribution and morphology protein 10, variant 2 [Taiwanofungus camphoratus]|nr:Mitochondrial distribution and morphology protein 10, variant 2 [Antrodia cinnamomea]
MISPEGRRERKKNGLQVSALILVCTDYLLYGRLYIPTGRLDALYSTRLTPTLQAMVAAISDPRSNLSAERTRETNTYPSNIMFSLQHDTGKWCTEYTWSVEDGMWGIRGLHNFGKLGNPSETADEIDKSVSTVQGARSEMKRIDEEDAMEGGLKGRLSAGAEFYFSAKERSAGVSTGVRFTTMPDATPPSFQLPAQPSMSHTSSASRGPPSQPPTTITALFNPMLGHITGAYAARVSRDLSLGSRFDFNVYSYESEWCVGVEWWTRRSKAKSEHAVPTDERSTPFPATRAGAAVPSDEVLGVVKARASTTTDVSVMWEGRLYNMLVSLGIVSNLSSRSKPIKAVGLELSYFSSG